ncbi:MAG: hypothetical protein BWY63_03361 [Chloroflexi bacterium ADurb.Bin360]|nr:MAG: hypothetical protein BWY63_03361 [Chloroflexi bacterium ADurb.Bin360]
MRLREHLLLQRGAMEGIGSDIGDGGEQTQIIVVEGAGAGNPQQARDMTFDDERCGSNGMTACEQIGTEQARLEMRVVVQIRFARFQHLRAQTFARLKGHPGEVGPDATCLFCIKGVVGFQAFERGAFNF